VSEYWIIDSIKQQMTALTRARAMEKAENQAITEIVLRCCGDLRWI
jgi:hypothetical protein